MVADSLDVVIGVDTHRDAHALALVATASGALLLEAVVEASREGYGDALEQRELEGEIVALARELAPQLLAQPGVGPITAAHVPLAWSHKGRLRNEAAFARLAGAPPIPASSGKVVRHRLDRGGDRKLNRALHPIILTRRRTDPDTIAYIQRRVSEGKSDRDAVRSLKRYLARSLFRQLEAHPQPA